MVVFSIDDYRVKASKPIGLRVGAVAPLVITEDRLAASSAEKVLTVGALKSFAASVLWVDEHHWKVADRIYQCGWGTFGQPVQLVLTQDGGAAYRGVKRCNSVWGCAECSRRISAVRRFEAEQLLEKVAAQGLAVCMLTLTAQHRADEAASDVLDDFREASAALQRHRSYRRLKPWIVGKVTVLEVTYGRNGWHVHTHVLLIMNASEAGALKLVETLRGSWIASLGGVGRTGNRNAFHVQGADYAAKYFTKFGLASELTSQTSKVGRRKGETSWQLLAAGRDGNRRKTALWLEFFSAFKGRRQLVWSPGLKARFGIGEVPDADCDDEAESVVREWTCSSHDRWREARHRRLMMVIAVISGTDLDEAEFGPTDLAVFSAMEERRRCWI